MTSKNTDQDIHIHSLKDVLFCICFFWRRNWITTCEPNILYTNFLIFLLDIAWIVINSVLKYIWSLSLTCNNFTRLLIYFLGTEYLLPLKSTSNVFGTMHVLSLTEYCSSMHFDGKGSKCSFSFWKRIIGAIFVVEFGSLFTSVFSFSII